MANRYQYETSPRKLEPEYEPIKEPYSRKKTTTVKKKANKPKQKSQIKTNIKTITYVFFSIFSLPGSKKYILPGFLNLTPTIFFIHFLPNTKQ